MEYPRGYGSPPEPEFQQVPLKVMRLAQPSFPPLRFEEMEGWSRLSISTILQKESTMGISGVRRWLKEYNDDTAIFSTGPTKILFLVNWPGYENHRFTKTIDIVRNEYGRAHLLCQIAKAYDEFFQVVQNQQLLGTSREWSLLHQPDKYRSSTVVLRGLVHCGGMTFQADLVHYPGPSRSRMP